MKKLLFATLFLISMTSFAQLMVPLFDIPQKVEKLSDNADEQTPITFDDGDAMFFNRFYEKFDDDGGVIQAQDTWFASKGKKGWGSPFRAFRDPLGRDIQLLIGSSRDGERLYLLNRYFEGDSIIHRIIYKTRSGKSTWKDPVEVKIPGIDLSDQQTTLFMHSDEDVMLVSMLTKDTSAVANEDLYLTHKQEDGTWSELIDLGPNINTKGLEFSPFLTHDKKALYFASNGHDGFGESDIFISYREEGRWDKWSRPLNLGLPINSSAFESSFVVSDTNQVYFTSDRESNSTDMYFTKATGKTKMANLGILAGKFMKEGKPMAGVKFNAYDLQGTFLETVETGPDGRFIFKKLVPDDKYEIKLDPEFEEDLSGSKLYLVDQKGVLKKKLSFDEEGVVDNSTDKTTDTLETVKGFFLDGGNPLLNTALIVQDENGFPIDTIYTNDVGQFKYTKLSADKELFFVPRDVNLDSETLDLYLVDEKGARAGSFLGEEALKENVFGKFAYNKLPLANTAIVVFDELGLPIDTIYTDDAGMYKYRKLKADGRFAFKPLDQSEIEIEDLEVTSLDAAGRKMQKLRLDTATGFYTDMTEEEAMIAYAEAKKKQLAVVEKVVTKTKKEPKKVEPKVDKEIETKVDQSKLSYILYFDFNQAFLGHKNGKAISQLIGNLKGSDSKIILTGHADNIGSDEVNNRIAKKRAEAAKAYFISKGISEARIVTESKGESSPIESNDTESGRAKNRRVEISIK